ncbi:MAG: hypothetical protein NTY96_00325 [Bacteroidetes bacterium]|nr:hypothetical protein [Bacteroidota bacterium]
MIRKSLRRRSYMERPGLNKKSRLTSYEKGIAERKIKEFILQIQQIGLVAVNHPIGMWISKDFTKLMTLNQFLRNSTYINTEGFCFMVTHFDDGTWKFEEKTPRHIKTTPKNLKT